MKTASEICNEIHSELRMKSATKDHLPQRVTPYFSTGFKTSQCYYDCSLLFWTDWGKPPRIERAFLDGSNRKAIVTDNLGN